MVLLRLVQWCVCHVNNCELLHVPYDYNNMTTMIGIVMTLRSCCVETSAPVSEKELVAVVVRRRGDPLLGSETFRLSPLFIDF